MISKRDIKQSFINQFINQSINQSIILDVVSLTYNNLMNILILKTPLSLQSFNADFVYLLFQRVTTVRRAFRQQLSDAIARVAVLYNVGPTV